MSLYQEMISNVMNKIDKERIECHTSDRSLVSAPGLK